VRGRQVQVSVKGPVHPSGNILSVTTWGKASLTAAETSREDVVLQALQGRITLTENPFFCSIWIPSFHISWPPLARKVSTKPLVNCLDIALNNSQDLAVRRILSEADNERAMLIQGPPGTGKTTVIAASVLRNMKSDRARRTTFWLVAHSNVAVKNIAEKLDKVEFHEFKILVSKDFHFDWYIAHCSLLHHTDFSCGRHEHLYNRLEDAGCFIRSDSFNDDIVGLSRRLLDTSVILCTLSTLSNPRIGDFARLVPVQTIIFDEASQIEVGDYLPVLQRFRPSLQKMVFIGDDKQRETWPIVRLSFVADLDHSGTVWPG
jgi:hypothetical protein